MLNKYQANAITVALRSLERVLFRLESLPDSSDGVGHGILLDQVNPLAPEQRASLSKLARQAEEVIELLTARFALESQTEDLAKLVRAHITVMWATLEDSKSHKLRRYGPVNPALGPLLDPEIEQLIDVVNAMSDVLLASSSTETQAVRVKEATDNNVGTNRQQF